MLYLGGGAVSPDELMFLTKSSGPKLIKYDFKHVWTIIVGFTSSASGTSRLGASLVRYRDQQRFLRSK